MKRWITLPLSHLFFLASFAQQIPSTIDTMPPVEVKSLRSSQRSPFAFMELNKLQLQKVNTGVDLPLALQQTPSLVASSDAGNGIGYTGLRIRGTDATRINITINGIPYNDAESQGTFLVNIPDLLSSAQSIQIHRGLGPSTNGTGAFGGSIHIQTNDQDTSAFTSWRAGYGSFNSWRNTVIHQTGLLKNNWILSFRGSLIGSDGYVDRASTSLMAGMASIRKLYQNREFRLNVITGREKTYAAWFGITPETLDTNRRFNPAGTEKTGTPYDNETDNYRQTHYQFFWNEKQHGHWTLGSTLFLTTGRGYFEQYKADERLSRYKLPNWTNGTDTFERADLVRQLWLDNRFYGMQFNALYRKNQFQMTIGSTINRYDGDHFGEVIKVFTPNETNPNQRWYDQPARKSEAALFVKAEQSFASGWNLFGDLQIRHVRYRINGFRNNPELTIDNRFLFFNPKAGISYLKNNWKFYASYARGAKEPNRDDFEAGTKDQPRPEKLNDWEAGLGYQKKDWDVDVNLYYMHYRDQLVLNGRVNDVFAYARTNIPVSFRRGIEISARWNILPSLIVRSNATLSQNKALDYTEYVDDYDAGIQQAYFYAQTNLAFSPEVMFNASAEWKLHEKLSLTWNVRHVGSQYLDNTSDRFKSLDAFWVSDVRADVTMMNKRRIGWTAFAGVNNLFSEKYEPNGYSFSYISENTLYRDRYYFPMATANFMLGMHIQWNHR
jgi:iron complex outermembrane receptor protein